MISLQTNLNLKRFPQMNNMRKIIPKIGLIGIILVLSVSSAWATNLRGRILRFNSYYNSYYPAAGVQVMFSLWNGRAWIPVARTQTQQDGMYYINLSPGNYYIQAPGVNMPITIYNAPHQDAPQINLPR